MSGPRAIVLLAAFDEAPRLPAVLAGLRHWEQEHEVVVVDDGSQDDTSRVARERGATVLRHPFNLGYGAALQTGYKYALSRGVDLLVQLDADGQHDPDLVPGLVARLQETSADLVLGSRFLEQTGYAMGRTRTLGRLLFLNLGRAVGLRVTDPTSGFQAMRRSMLELYVQDFFPSDYPDVNVLILAHRCGRRIVEHPVRMHESTRPSRLHGGLRSLYYVYRIALALWAGTVRAPSLRRESAPEEATQWTPTS